MVVNKTMEIKTLASTQDLIYSAESQHGDHFHYEGVDPHFWTSPKSATIIATDIKNLLVGLNPEARETYEENYISLIAKIESIDKEIATCPHPTHPVHL